MKKYLNVKTAGIVFLFLLVILIFFSKTIYTSRLPSVTAAMPFNGKLSKLETATGLVSWAELEEVYAEVGGRVEEIFVTEGMSVSEGQPLIRLNFDTDEVQQKLYDLNLGKEKLRADIQNINLKINKANDNRKDLQSEQQREVSKAQKDYDTLKSMYEMGAISKAELDSSLHSFESLIAKYEKQVVDSRYEVDSLRQDLTLKNLDLANLDHQEAPYREALANDSAVLAPKSGTIASLPVKKGQKISDEQTIAHIGIGSAFELTCDISLDNNFVIVGDRCEMSNSERFLEGVVTALTPQEQAKQVTISIEGQAVTNGETFTVTFEKQGENTEILVPNGALNMDSDGYFLYQIKKRDGILGKEYYAEKLRVYIGDADDENTVIIKGLTFFEPIVSFSDKAFSEGETIRVQNEGDLFEN